MSTITPMPTAPTRTDPLTFSARADAWDAALVLLGPEINVVAAEVDANAVFASTASGQAGVYAASAAASAVVATAAASLVNVLPWTDATYAIGDPRYSLVNLQTYRCATAGVRSIDPALDLANWTLAIDLPASGGVASTASITLTSQSEGAMTVTPATPGLYITLPDATTCIEGALLYSLYNAGGYDYGVKNSAGTVLGWVRPKTGAIIGLSDNTTSAGVWSANGLIQTAITASYVNASATNTGNTCFAVTLDADRTMIFFGGTSLWAVIYNQTTQTWGTAVLVRASVAASFSAGILCATDKVLVCTCGNAAVTMEAVVVSAAGTVATVNTANKASVSLSANGYSPSNSQLVAVGSSFVFGYSMSGSVVAIRALTVATNTPTIGAESVLTASYVYEPLLFVSGSVVRALSYTTVTAYIQPYTVSGTTLTLGTGTSFTIATQPRCFQNGNGNIVAVYQNGAAYTTVLKLTGTVEAASNLNLGFTLGSNVWDYCEVSASKTFIIGWTGGGTWTAAIVTDTAGAASVGSLLTGISPSAVNSVACSTVLANSVTVAANATSMYSSRSFNCSATAPTLTSMANANFATGFMAYAGQKPLKGIRNYQTMLFAGRVLSVGGGSSYGDTEYTANSLRKIAPGVMPMSMGSGSVLMSNSDAYFVAAIDNASGGMTISRVEGI